MTSTRLIVATTGTLAVAFLAAGQTPPEVRPGRTPVVAASPQAAAPAKPHGDDRNPERDAAREDEKSLLKFFEIRDRARSVVYAIDCSGSMALRNALDVAKRELLASLDQLPPEARFAVIFYNLEARILSDDQGHQGLMAATAANRKRVQSQVTEVKPDGGTDHMTALRAALALKPEVVFLLTDADLVTNGDVDEILAEMGKAPKPSVGADGDLAAAFRVLLESFRRPAAVQKTRIQVIELGRGPEANQKSPLRRLATSTGGSYLDLDVTKFPRVRP
jgi:hypothetical protein